MPAPDTAHRHDVQFFHDETFLAREVAVFIGAGLAAHAGAIVIATQAHLDAVEARLREQDLDVSEAVSSGQLILADAGETLDQLLRDGKPDPDRFTDIIGKLVEKSLAKFGSLSAYGEMVDLLAAKGRHEDALALEECWNRLLAGKRAHLLCGYRLDAFGNDTHSEPFRHVCLAHSRILPTEKFTELDNADRPTAVAALEQKALVLESEIQRRKEVEKRLLRTQADLKSRSEELTRSNAELEKFAYVVAHDLKEPLRMVTQFLGLLSRRGASSLDDKLREYISFSMNGAQRMGELIDGLLRYGKLGHASTSIGEVDTTQLLADVLTNMDAMIRETRATVTCGAMPKIQADSVKLRQVFENLLGNSVKYRSQSAPAIQFHAVEQPEAWIFSVADNGIGIGPEYHDAVFDLFKRIGAPNLVNGTGVGLAVCKQVVEQHGGRIWVEPVTVGTTIRFTIPRKASSRAAQAQAV